MASKSPTQRSLEKLRVDGFVAEVVEKWVPMKSGGFRKDFLGFIDILAFNPQLKVTIGVQACHHGDTSKRARKILDEPKLKEKLVAWRLAGNEFVIWGWDGARIKIDDVKVVERREFGPML